MSAPNFAMRQRSNRPCGFGPRASPRAPASRTTPLDVQSNVPVGLVSRARGIGVMHTGVHNCCICHFLFPFRCQGRAPCMASANSAQKTLNVQQVSPCSAARSRFHPHFQGFKKIFNFFPRVNERPPWNAGFAPMPPREKRACNAGISGAHLLVSLPEMPTNPDRNCLNSPLAFLQRHQLRLGIDDVRYGIGISKCVLGGLAHIGIPPKHHPVVHGLTLFVLCDEKKPPSQTTR